MKNRKPYSYRALSVVAIASSLLAAPAFADEPLVSDASPELAQNASDDGLPASRDALFGDVGEAAAKPAKSGGVAGALRGYVQLEAARTIESPEHWSKLRARAEIGTQGKFGDGFKYKFGLRIDGDAAYTQDDIYPAAVRRDQRGELSLRENYLDYGTGNWEFRLGRQHVVWGEMIGLFFADVVSARDMREFILPDFDALRIPQWAGRAEYFKDDFHAEVLWIPVASYDNIGKPGADFFPYQPVPAGAISVYRSEVKPSRNASNTNYGLRLSALKEGWDLTGFYYRSMDIAPTFSRTIAALAPTPVFVFEARHDRIEQIGGTVAKDFGSVVLKSEAVYTRGRSFTVLDPADIDGLTPSNTLDWAAGLDFSLPAETRLNVQLFQRIFASHDSDMISKKRESGYSLYLTSKLTDHVEAQALLIASLDRNDWMLRPKVIWNFEKNWRLSVGADIFKGPVLGLFGRYDANDRVYSELRYSF